MEKRVSHAVSLDDPRLLRFWTERHLCTVTTTRADGGLHVTPMGIVLDAPAGLAWGITSSISVKARNLRERPEIAACQLDGRWWSSLMGKATVSDDPDVVREAEERYAARYKQPRVNPERVAVRITIERILANLPLTSAE
jgi:PPOX class probable F420-dependent enzyme